MMKILVTGASGFLGNHVVSDIVKRGHEVIATCNCPEKAKEYDWYDRVTYISQNLANINDDYYTFFGKPDRLIHLAWEGLPNYKSFSHIESNLFWNWQFLRNIVEHGLNDVTVIGTCLEYGMKNGMLNEDEEPKPTTPYGLAKDSLRRFLEQLQSAVDFKLKWVRLFYMYGPGQNPKSLLSQLEQALSQDQEQFNMSRGDQIRDYLPVETVARYIFTIALQNKITGIVNCCSGKPVTVLDLVNKYLEGRNKSIKLNLGYYSYPDYEPMEFWGDSSKLNKILKDNDICLME
ncbi:MAG: NAD(P)-dependent oxidoreductase [Sedimentisphaerales bacterium]|nr:NAD(P)-dependent oxidoreductase [Sedimentisphaerales bacterium]